MFPLFAAWPICWTNRRFSSDAMILMWHYCNENLCLLTFSMSTLKELDSFSWKLQLFTFSLFGNWHIFFSSRWCWKSSTQSPFKSHHFCHQILFQCIHTQQYSLLSRRFWLGICKLSYIFEIFRGHSLQYLSDTRCHWLASLKWGKKTPSVCPTKLSVFVMIQTNTPYFLNNTFILWPITKWCLHQNEA